MRRELARRFARRHGLALAAGFWASAALHNGLQHGDTLTTALHLLASASNIALMLKVGK